MLLKKYCDIFGDMEILILLKLTEMIIEYCDNVVIIKRCEESNTPFIYMFVPHLSQIYRSTVQLACESLVPCPDFP